MVGVLADQTTGITAIVSVCIRSAYAKDIPRLIQEDVTLPGVIADIELDGTAEHKLSSYTAYAENILLSGRLLWIAHIRTSNIVDCVWSAYAQHVLKHRYSQQPPWAVRRWR